MTTFAIFFAGGGNRIWNHERYAEDFRAILTRLRGFPGLSADTIKVLSGEGGNPFQFEGTTIYGELANRENLRQALASVAARAGSPDRFFFFSSNHGGKEVPDQKSSSLICWGRERVTPKELANWSKDIRCNFQAFILGQCYSGGFIDDLQADKRAILAACDWDEVSWASRAMCLRCDEFMYRIAEGFEGLAPTLNALFAYAKKADLEREKPQFSDPGRIGDIALWK